MSSKRTLEPKGTYQDHGENVDRALLCRLCGLTQLEILEDLSELELADTLVVLAFAADREHRTYSVAVQ